MIKPKPHAERFKSPDQGIEYQIALITVLAQFTNLEVFGLLPVSILYCHLRSEMPCTIGATLAQLYSGGSSHKAGRG